jgi:hypothetical protein
MKFGASFAFAALLAVWTLHTPAAQAQIRVEPYTPPPVVAPPVVVAPQINTTPLTVTPSLPTYSPPAAAFRSPPPPVTADRVDADGGSCDCRAGESKDAEGWCWAPIDAARGSWQRVHMCQ